MPKWAKSILAVLLLPFCVGAVTALWRVAQAGGQADTIWVATLAGAASWLAVYLLLPKPMLVYIFGHELTHALWGWLFGARVKKFKAGPRGGHVILSRSNFLITLAPYFFPLYALLVGGCFVLGHLAWEWTGYLVWFHLLVGAAYAFHVTLTWHVLQVRQPDLTSQGYVFSAVIIFLGNAVVLLAGLPLLLGQPGIGTAFGWWLGESWAVWMHLGGWFPF